VVLSCDGFYFFLSARSSDDGAEMKEPRFQTERKMVHSLNHWEKKKELLQNCICLFSLQDQV